jgi:hypothetical protein
MRARPAVEPERQSLVVGEEEETLSRQPRPLR